MATPVRVLILEDRRSDVELMLRELQRAEFEPSWQWAMDERQFLEHLDPGLDVILADYTLPQFDACRALQLLKQSELDIPFIVVTGTVGEEVAVECMKRGAADYLLKDRLARLGQAVQHALAAKRQRTELKQAEEQRARLLREQAARAQAERALQLRDEFLSVAVHELKTPMTSLRGFVQLALRDLDQEESTDGSRVHRALEVIDVQSQRLMRLVGQLLDLSRIDSGRLVLDRKTTDLSSIVESVVAAARVISGRCPIAVDTPASMLADVDPVRIEQVLTNLVDNAVKFSPDGGQVEVEIPPLTEERVHIAVTDHGIGIPPEQRGRIFDRFYQVHPDLHSTSMGLGLYISREIIELHGGQLEAEFPAAGGTRFVVTLPAKAGPTPGDVSQPN